MNLPADMRYLVALDKPRGMALSKALRALSTFAKMSQLHCWVGT